MTAKLAAAVQDRLEAPTAGNNVTLIVGVSDEDAIERISEIGGSIEEELPYDCLAVSIDEADLEELCNLDNVTSVEMEKEYHTLGDSDFFFH